MPDVPQCLLVSTPVLAALLKVSVRRAQQMHSEGVFPAAGHGQWDALICVPAANQHRLESEIARVTKTPSEDRVRDLRADEIALRIERESGALIAEARAEGLAIVQEHAVKLRSGVLSVPVRLIADLALRKRVVDELAVEFDVVAKAAKSASASPPPPPNRAARRAGRHV